jgi:hypothetical protein
LQETVHRFAILVVVARGVENLGRLIPVPIPWDFPTFFAQAVALQIY